MTALAAHKESVLSDWQVKSDSLKQDKDLQQFNREADHIDSATGAHLKVLERMNSNSATTDNDVDVHIKRFEDFAATVHAQEERVKVFVESADQLQRAGHPQAPAIQDKREKVVVARDKLKKEMATVRAHLEESKLFEEFKMQLLEMQDFIKDKQEMATKEESGANKDDLKAKAKKHEVLEGEIKANSGQLKVLNRTGQQMIARSHYNADKIASDLEGLNTAWEGLVGTVKSEDSRLGQAKAQAEYNQMTADVKNKLEDIKSMVSSEDVGKDMRYCKALVSQHNAAEQELDTVDAKIVGLTQVAPELADGHFDSANILSTCKGLEAAVADLKPAAAERRAALNRSMKYHEFRFDLARELEWIGEKTTILTTAPDIKGLQAAQRTVKKHKKLEEEINNHSVVIQKVVASGQTLLDDNPQDGNAIAEDILANTGDLEQAWQQLAQLSKQKEEEYLVALKAQQYYFEVAEIESWIAEKSQGLKSQEYGKDESSSIKLLTRHKGVELEIDTYSGIIQELSNSSSQLISSGHPDSKIIKGRDDMLNRELRALKNLAKERRDRLVQTIQLHEYLRETEEVKEYITQQRNNANFQDIGRDYEHFEILLARFQEFKLKLQAGEEKFRGCEALARRLDNLDPALGNNFDVKEVQSDLTNRWLELIQAIEKRDQALESAGEIHRFNRDIAEALSRIGEKEAILQTEDKGNQNIRIDTVSENIIATIKIQNNYVAIQSFIF
jgi:spectrin beta